ncbi:hypothetical protein GQ53DRAFT_758063 [Thozetella sp. PMI_491]|nr:hypothetical protein GQ53DRAFT_758063 [Thozetella sp. PMI_491]
MRSTVFATLAAAAGIASATTPVVFDFNDIAVPNTKSCAFKKWSNPEVYQGVQWTNMVYTLNRTETSACSGDPVHLPPYPDGLFPGWGDGGAIGVANGTLRLNMPDLTVGLSGNIDFYLRIELSQEEIDAGDATQLVEIFAGDYTSSIPIQRFETQTGIDGNFFEWYHIPNTAPFRFLEIRARTWLVDRPQKYRDALFYITHLAMDKI